MRRPVATAGVLVVVVAAAVVRPWEQDGGVRVVAEFDAVPGLVEGAEVERAGVRVGRVERIALVDGRPRVTLRLREGERLHRGARADLRIVSLSGQLNRVVALADGRGPRLRDGATLGLARTDQPVEIETVLATLDPPTRRAVRELVAGADRATAGRGEALAATLRRASRTLAAAEGAIADATADGAALRQVVTTTRRVTDALAAGDGEQRTAAAVDRLAAVVGDSASEQAALRDALAALPDGLRAPRATLDRFRRQLPRLRTTARRARPAVDQIAAAAPELRTTLAAAGPVLRQTEAVVTDGPRQLGAVAPLVAEATPVLRTATRALRQANPILDESRVRLPDFFSFFSNWADATANYDANGHGFRVGLTFPPAPLRVASPDGQDAGHLARPFLRPPGSLQGEPWNGWRSSLLTAGSDAP
ncbi:MlaD family protein [Patulibacter defluvii]|uniref:MlaD family protein n=1 Tax=Patulibacter defluvii TaxID=3095358 RepID=UPI002A753CF8|nr:MlaD family protein [Patulibacter sp. DM4]